MPGSNARALEKAPNLPADGIILDLEDSVAPDAKAVARDQIAKAIAAGGFGKREVLIRVNSLDTPWWVDDVTMAGKVRPDGILVPKISTVADLNAIANRLSDINADMSIRVWAMLETARGVLDADKLAAAAKDSETRLAGFVFGPNDISRETRIQQPGRAAMIPMITHCILATRAHGLEILDGPYSDISNIDGFAVECAQGRDLGFDGKTLIHPSHIEACNAIFTPPAEEVEQARKIIAAFEKPENASRGAIQLDGRMVERLHADMARRTIAIADAIAAMGLRSLLAVFLPPAGGSKIPLVTKYCGPRPLTAGVAAIFLIMRGAAGRIRGRTARGCWRADRPSRSTRGSLAPDPAG
jgi:citrate lyase subunit beta/citryl-CoA lyase